MNAAEPVRIGPADLGDDRFSRLRLIPWWRQDLIARARILVVGAGALGNEILKNLALLGFRNILLVDLDRIEASNLSRGVLFRLEDVGQPKAHVGARAVRELFPQAVVQPLHANLLQDVGLGVFAWADVILGALDNREARLFLNRAAWKLGKPWVDGAIEGLNGVARVFEPGKPACYECTLGEVDWAILNRRMSCNLLTAADEEAGKVPTTPTSAAVIAGIQVQELLKLLHGLPVLSGKGFVFEGLTHSSYLTEYVPDPDCMSHYTLPPLIHLPGASGAWTLAQLAARAAADLQTDAATIEFSRDIVWKLVHPASREEHEIFARLGSVTPQEARDPRDGVLRELVLCHSYYGQASLAHRRLDALGLPPYDVFIARSTGGEAAYLFDGDAPAVLGELAEVPE